MGAFPTRDAVFADDAAGRRWGFSAKRHREYYPAKARDHIAETTYPAHRYVLLLARPASAEVQAEVDRHPGWEVWDARDLCRRVRDLRAAHPEAARELVDYHFGPVWRRDFLGLPAAAAFLPPADHFRDLLDPRRLFHHGLDLIGRAGAAEALAGFAADPAARIAVLPGRGGVGKTRLLRAVAERVEQGGAEPAVRFWVEGLDASPDALDELPDRPTLVVIDDAHRRDGLGPVLALVRRRAGL